MNSSENLTQPGLSNYHYNKQLRRYVTQFMAIFYDLKVKRGKNDFEGSSDEIHVPIVYGSMDRVAAAIKAENTQNKPIRLPLMTATLRGIQLNADRLTGLNVARREVRFMVGGDIKKDLRTIEQLRPLAYDFTFLLTLHASNTEQHFQMLEQILVMFDPTLQIQTSDSPYDPTKIIDCVFESMELTENNPAETNNRSIVSELTFRVRGYMYTPADVKDNVIQKIRLRVQQIHTGGDFEEEMSDLRRDDLFLEIFNSLDHADIPKN